MAKNDLATVVRDRLAGALATQGVLAVLFGLVVLVWPGLSATLFVTLFGVLVLAWGVVSLVHSFLGVGRANLWWLGTIFSLLAIGLGVYLLRNPGVAIAAVILFTALVLIVRGVVDLLMAFFSRDEEIVESRWFFGLAGVIGLVLGVIVLAYPAATGLAFVWAVGLYFVLVGAVNVALAFRVRA